MNAWIDALYKMAGRKHQFIIGLMSGTSLDGLDIAYCRVTGSGSETKVDLQAFRTVPYEDTDREKIRKVFAQKQVDLAYLTMLNSYVGKLHAKMVNRFLFDHNIVRSRVDLIASHGQTVMHVPHGNFDGLELNTTLQIGDGDHLAVDTGIITVSDFRQKHVAAGGEGAPLALYGDYLLFAKKGENRILLNIGGIANFTFIPDDALPMHVTVTDSGPGNTIMDAYMKKYFDMLYDQDAALASQGAVLPDLLSALRGHTFFTLDFPRTTGPELFNLNYLKDALAASGTGSANHADIMCTLNRFTAESIATAIRAVTGERRLKVYMSGGGASNPLLVHNLRQLLKNVTFEKTDTLGVPADAKEAVLFAVLANETVSGRPVDFGRKEMPSVTFGKISFPG
jgi:anhydro-N-acetylmuramic acid kinase